MTTMSASTSLDGLASLLYGLISVLLFFLFQVTLIELVRVYWPRRRNIPSMRSLMYKLKRRQQRMHRRRLLGGRSEATLTAERHKKIIQEAVARVPPDIETLHAMAHLGFADDQLRREVWPILLGINPKELELNYADCIFKHKYYEQVNKDIERSMHHFDVTKAYQKMKRAQARESLQTIIHAVFSKHKDLHYVQGFHDICSVFLIVCGEPLAFKMTERLSLMHIRDSLRPSLDTVVQVLSLIFPLIECVDPEVHRFLVKTQVQSLFTLSWVLTWFSHNIVRFDRIVRIFDFLLASHPLMPMYFAASLILHMREGLLQLVPDYAEVHRFFQELPEDLDISQLFQTSMELFDSYPPTDLLKKARVKFPHDSPLTVVDPKELPVRFRKNLQKKEGSRQSLAKIVLPAAAIMVVAVLIKRATSAVS